MFTNDWNLVLKDILNTEYFNNLLLELDDLYESNIIYPPRDLIFNALNLTSYKDVKVVILGQDPYHGEGEAEGLSFSVRNGIKLPPSLKNIYKELYSDLGITNLSGSLVPWSRQGVLLLNSILTVKKDLPLSLKYLNWEVFTDNIISLLNKKDTPVVFILWGNFARSKKHLITNPKHLVIESVHPSPFSARNGFFGSKPFSKTNEFLINNNITPINWQL